MKKLLSLILAVLMIVPSLASVSHAAETTVLEDIVVGVNEHYIGSGYQKKIADAFAKHLANAGYSCNIEYRTLGNSSTTAAQLGKLINAAGDIDFVLAAGLNIDSTAGVKIIAKKLHKSEYNSDGGRYGALLTDKFAARLLYNFVTGGCHHLYDNACDATCNVCAATRTPSAHAYSSASDTTCNSCGKKRTVTKLDDIVIGVNQHYIGSGYQKKIADAFAAYAIEKGYVFNVEYRTLGNSSTTAAQLGKLVNAAGDIDLVLSAGSNIDSTAGVKILAKKLHKTAYNSDGKRYGALLTNTTGAAIFYYFLTGGCYHVYSNACDASCNACGATRTASAHTYSNACDATCNSCGAKRTVPAHVYTDSSDATCNVCGFVREVVVHVYDNACDATCNDCGATRTPAAHVYDNDCDTSCNVCGATRAPGEHSYSNACDATCNDCGATRTPAAHVYSNACDKSCNVCGATRTASAHVYTNACDASCNVCGATRTVADHVYDNDKDAFCNICNHERNVNTFEKIVVGINQHYVGSGYQTKISNAFAEYMASKGYTCDIEYRVLGNSSTTAAQLGKLINAAGDIDFVIAAGSNIDSTAGVKILAKKLHKTAYNSDGKRYGALLTDKPAALILYYFLTGGCYHLYDNSCDTFCNVCGASRATEHTYSNDTDTSCNVCGETRAPFSSVTLVNGTNVNFIPGIDTSASNAPVISGSSSVKFTADSDTKDEVWEISFGDHKLDPNKIYTVKFSLYNAVGNVGVGCVRDEYVEGVHGVNTFYGNFANPSLVSSNGQDIRARRGFYEIETLVEGARTAFPYSSAYVDSEGYVSLKMNVQFNGTTYVSTLYYLNKSSKWVAIDEAYVGVSSSNTFGLYVLHGAAAGCVTSLKDIKYSIDTAKTSYPTSVTTPTIKLIDYNVQTGNSYHSATANWLLAESPDVIGLQEVGPAWYTDLKNALGGTYGYVGTARQGSSSTSGGNEASPIFYKKSEYALISGGTKWLSNTPDTVGSKVSGSLYIRVMTYAILYHKDTGTIYIYVNTHLDNSNDTIREQQVNILMNLVATFPSFPTVLSGDLNGGLDSGVIKAIENNHKYTSLAKTAKTKNSAYTDNTYWEGASWVLDYVFLNDMSKFTPLSYTIGNTSARCSVYKYSDHYPLITTFNLK